MHEYISLSVAVMICATQVNIIHTYRQTDSTVTSLYEKLSHLS